MSQLLFTCRCRPASLALAACLLFSFISPAESFRGIIRAEGTQGDLVTVSREGKPMTIRLYGVACPVAGQPLADGATSRVLEAAMESTVTVELVGQDTAGTPVARVTLPDGRSLNEDLVRQGLAWWDAPNTPEARGFQRAATEAISAKRGLWSTPAPLAPWDYRASNGLAPVAYRKADPAPAKPATPAPPQQTPTIQAKGDGQAEDYFPEDPAEHMALMIKHQPRIVYDKTGKPVGLTADDIASVPGAKRVGLQDGDIVRSVNGIALTDEAQVLGLVTQLQGVKQLDLAVQRNGAITKISIPLE
ncbi:MAG: thermonuclease family protein [Candidatus Hydrogenedentes bacterium]|nr:thermonuclease family protein [Candidatus Hydrogenedentota bacterium]